MARPRFAAGGGDWTTGGAGCMATIRTSNRLPVGGGVDARTAAPAASPGTPPVGFCVAAPAVVEGALEVVPPPAAVAVVAVRGVVVGGVTPGVCCGAIWPAGTEGAEAAAEMGGCPEGMAEGPCGTPRRVAVRVAPTDRLAIGDPMLAGPESAAPGVGVRGAEPAAKPAWEPAADVPAARADGCERFPWVATLPPTAAIRRRTLGTSERIWRITSAFFGRARFV